MLFPFQEVNTLGISTSIAVLTCAVTYCFQYAFYKYRQHQANRAIGELSGCLPPPTIQNRRPFRLDHIEQLFRADRESYLMELLLFHIRQTGNTLKHIFLLSPAFGTIEPANLESILSTNFKDWGIGPRRKITFPMFGDGIFTQEGPAWKYSREILRPQLYHKQYKNLEVFKEAINDLLNVIPKNGGIIDLQPLFFRLTLDTTAKFLFGDSIRSLKIPDSDEQTFAKAFNTAQIYIIKRLRLGDLYWLISGRKFRQACNIVNNFANRIIDRNLSRDRNAIQQEKYIFLDSIANSVPHRTALRGQIINVLAAGRDSTACLLSWTLYVYYHIAINPSTNSFSIFLLLRHPQVFEKLRAEIATLSSNDAKINRTCLRSLKYLQNVLKETLRLYPALPINTRTALRTTVLPTGGGPEHKTPVLIPKGATIAYSIYSMHRRPDLYGMDAELFRPERWDEELPLYSNPTNAKWGYLPFNGGPRSCLGMDFALTEAAYTMVHLIRRFPQMSLPPGEVVQLTGAEKQTMTLVLSITEGCRVQLQPRK